uniref:non-specific serine/threonine protein kinase n=1 Tax=Salix viminalis TaxID=40686 RepID=A0A6N2LHJ2_SALVM
MKHFSLDSDLTRNYINGTIPPRLGQLPKLKIFVLSANNFTGTIPDTFGNLKSLNDFRIDGSELSGKIPEFIGNWINIQIFILRNCLITGSIPEYIANMSSLKILDLSINRLTGNISIFKNLASVPISEQQLTNWRSAYLDIEQKEASILVDANSRKHADEWCFTKGLPCKQNPEHRSLFINCGGDSNLRFNDNTYEVDSTDGGPASFFFSPEKWGYISTGLYLDSNKTGPFLAKNDFNLRVKDVYETARLAPQSLKYYALCLAKGKYKVQLHFAEIMYSNDQTYKSLGRRIFDISIQGITLRKNFNIAEQAGGVGIATIEVFDNIIVNGSTLEIHLYWAGKGTTFVPERGVHGPLISAITGVLSDGPLIAVKQLSSKSRQGNREFVNEIGMISALQHPHLVKLYGCCIEGNQLLLVYEYLENNSLARALFGPEEHQLQLNWQTRKKILLGIAKGLSYLHEESRLKIVHRDIKATNVLLDTDLNAKISDFGLAKLDEEENTHISTRIAGTIGYMAPEYAMRGYLTDKADVYSFGVVALEVVSGKSNTNYRPKEDFVYLLDWAYVLHERNNLLELVDPRLGSSYSKEEAMKMLHLALLCTNQSPSLRPLMSSVVRMLEGNIPVKAPIINHGGTDQEARFRALELVSQVSTSSQSSEVQRSKSRDGPWIDSSFSLQSQDEAKDLYPISID